MTDTERSMHATRAFVYPALVAWLAGCATATSTEPSRYPGYAISETNRVVRTGTGDCLRAGTPDRSVIVGECEPERLARAAPPAAEPAPAAEAAPAPPAEIAAAPPGEPAVRPAQGAAPATAPSDTGPLAVVPPPAGPAEPSAPQRALAQFVLGTDAYFGFDQAELTEEARRKLDTIVVERARRAEDPKIRIVGHADRIGEADYNLNLSQRRADAVRTYLIEQGIDEAAIEVDARGETDPIVQCEGRFGASLIDCLQVNRRSEIEFSALEPVDR